MKDKIIKLIILNLFLMVVGIHVNGQDSTKLDSSEKYSGPIIDMHIHAYERTSSLFGREMTNPITNKTYMASKSIESHKKETLSKFGKYNIVKAVVSQHAEDWYQTDSSKILIGKGYGFDITYLRGLHQDGKLHIIGEVAPNYSGLLPTDTSLTKYFDLAEELDIPIAFHMYPGGPPGGAYFAYPKTRASQGKPLQLEEILIARPNMRIYIMHAGWPYLEDMKALMYAHLQVYVDVGVISWALPRKEFHKFIEGLVDAGFGKRIMFGTDQMQWVSTIDEAIEAVNSADFLTLQQKEDIFYNNASRFLKLSKEEIRKHKND